MTTETPPQYTWKWMLAGVFLMALGLSVGFYLDGDDRSMLPLRLMMAVASPVLLVGGAFQAGRMSRQSA